MATTRIVVTELPPDTITPEPWQVVWSNQLGEHTHVHHSKKAAQRHVRGLLGSLAVGVSRDEALTINRLET
ncbi:uncharacterized protein RMCC_5869 [Mycolicibacterium canariasense]|uniref:Uncharacterized protein n=1 Tax=Mycolicibacterium canariasense TaxID=228230 RepID=A0A100WJ83_MYCCR|nr:hypothetical protein [Mycolicibacterium canariasense]MCV7210534.1 hypothetical protein [Mycolicibacterium canariasense]GAS98904.1 uncharacterized protein RMCC_5869 [Mycolicibacterium canariasense]